MSTINFSGEVFTQSPYIYLQASGSDGSDGTVLGFNVRWAFRNVLQERHLPKGEYAEPTNDYPASYGFNKPDDFVHVYRTLFEQKYYTEINFNNSPTAIVGTGATREWHYNNIAPYLGVGTTNSNVVISFPDTAMYDNLAAGINPATQTLLFIANYNCEVNISVTGKLCFRVEYDLDALNYNNLPGGQLRHESISLSDSRDSTSKKLSCRKTNTAPVPGTPIIETNEDIESIRFDRTNVFPVKIRLYTYIDYAISVNGTNAWEDLGDYALTTVPGIAEIRLEDAWRPIDNSWPKFNNDDQVTGKFTVKKQNYIDRLNASDGLKFGVERYLDLSMDSNNYRAEEVLSSTLPGDNSSAEVSYLDMIRLASIDFHVARMLGLGMIDRPDGVRSFDEYIYIAEYISTGDIEDGGGARQVTHHYMGPALSYMQFKLPEVPTIKEPITYGLTVDNGTLTPSALTDPNGYTPFQNSRFVNINRLGMNYETGYETFFENSNEFCLHDHADPVGFGLEYGLMGNPYIEPELNHSPDYSDVTGMAETNMIPNTEANPLYRHQEQEEGVHCYALYSVSWFSRASGISNSVCTDETVFGDKKAHILPPSNFAAQLVQEEAPPILTTVQEQTDYTNIVGDKTYVRASFDWNYQHHKAHQFADKAELFFNKLPRKIVQGKITAINVLADNKVEITTTSYDILSASPMETVQPVVLPGQESLFEGSILSSGGRSYIVDQVVTTDPVNGENPKFILHQIRETNSVENPTGSNIWMTTETYISPDVNDRFLVGENLSDASTWDNRLLKSIHLETFGKNNIISIESSTYNNGDYHTKTATVVGANTEIKVKSEINDSILDGNIVYTKTFRSSGFNGAQTGYLIAGDVTAEFTGVSQVSISGSIENDSTYTVTSVAFDGTNTNVTLGGALDTSSSVAFIGISKTAAITAYDTTNQSVTIAGDLTSDISPVYHEDRTNSDGTITELVMGGMVDTCQITELEDVDSSGNIIPGSYTGVYTLTFTGNSLIDHIDPDVRWFRGKVRIMEDASYLPVMGRTTTLMKELDVWNISEDGSGNLVLTASDPDFDNGINSGSPGIYVPIVTGASIQINYHPSYLFYLTVDEETVNGVINEFNEDSILPDFEEGTRQTLMGIRAIDSINNTPGLDDCVSHVAPPVTLNAQEIRPPMPPQLPSGPLYATRPDFYGKSTYTLDIGFNNTPYSVLVYKANDRKILDTLYDKLTVEQILTDLAAISNPDYYFTDRWSGLVNVDLEMSGPNIGEFMIYATDNYRFPIPDNADYVIPSTSLDGVTPINPFNGTDAPGSGVTFSVPGNPAMTMEEVVKEAIASAFVSQTEAPMIYKYIKAGEQTSNAKPRIRDNNDRLIAPNSGNPLYDPTPFAVKLPSGNLRFTDYNIDGGSISHYFYYAVELSDRQQKSAPSPIAGPIQLVNTRPANAPSIKKVTTVLENPDLETQTAVIFELEEYIASEQISRVDIYRAIDETDAISIRTMDLAKQIDITGSINEATIIDDFDGLSFPLYGEDLYYRIVALRKITLEDGITTEYIPSQTSKLVKTSIVDVNNPVAPCLVSENGYTTSTELHQVVLKWKPVGYNCTYSLQKMNETGNWQEVYTVKTNDENIQYPPLVLGSPDFVNYPDTASLSRQDEDLNDKYHKYRIKVENSSGLFNITECPIILATGCSDLANMAEYVSYIDGHGHFQNQVTDESVDDGINNNPEKMTFIVNIPGMLPAGHNYFDHIDVVVTDDLGNTASATITSGTPTVVFNDGDGDTAGDSLQLLSANRTYTIQTTLYTDYCTSGYSATSVLKYIQGPCNELSKLDSIVQLTDDTHTITLDQNDFVIDDGVNKPVSLTFTDISNVAGMTSPQTFSQLDVTLTDGFGNADTKSITTISGSVTFTDGDNGLILDDGDQNRSYTLSLNLTTTECASGHTYDYEFYYSYDPYNDLSAVTDIVSFTDNNMTSVNPLVSGNIDDGVNNPDGSITIADLISSNLPAGHTITNIDVSVSDKIGGSATKVLTPTGNVTFSTGDGETGSTLDLSAANPNTGLDIEVSVYTNLCPYGVNFAYHINYTYDPYEDLASQTDIVDYQDANAYTKAPLESEDFNDGVNTHPGGSMTFTETISSNLPAGDTFTKVEVTVEDGIGGVYMDEITVVSGSVTISHGDGGLVMNGTQPNLTYTFSLKVYSTLCPDGVLFVYAGRYTKGL